MENQYDIIIVGGGLVGASLILALKNLPLKVALLEKNIPAPSVNPKNSRPLSLNHASFKILTTLGIWQALANKASPIQDVHVSEKGHFGSVKFEAKDYGIPALGYVVPAAILQQVLQDEAQKQSPFILIDELLQIAQHENDVTLHYRSKDSTESAHTISGKLLIVCDGANSTCRTLLNISTEQHDLQQTAFSAILDITRPHQQKAVERLSRQGVIALLPLKNPLQYGLVWTVANQFAKEMQLWNELDWQQQIIKQFGARLGDISKVRLTGSYPLQTIFAKELFRKNILLIGNAARTISPIAAQGFNLALREVALLAEKISDVSASSQYSIGDSYMLNDFCESFKPYRDKTIQFTQGIGAIFDVHYPGAATFRAKGLLAMEYAPRLKNKLAEQFLGIAGVMPKLVRGIELTKNL